MGWTFRPQENTRGCLLHRQHFCQPQLPDMSEAILDRPALVSLPDVCSHESDSRRRRRGPEKLNKLPKVTLARFKPQNLALEAALSTSIPRCRMRKTSTH